jgi:hypothetical protein
MKIEIIYKKKAAPKVLKTEKKNKVKAQKAPLPTPQPYYDGPYSCPDCGEPFDPDEHKVVMCAKCRKLGSTKCCCPNGIGGLCKKCDK